MTERWPALIDGDPVSNALRDRGAWDEHVLEALRPYATDTVIDVGAGVGALAVPLAATAKRVLAFEVNPGALTALERNTEALPNVTVFRAGVYSRPVRLAPAEGMIPQWPSTWAWVPSEGGDPNAMPYHTPAHVSAVKVDAQGADLHVLMGLEEVIERDRPAIVIEWEPQLAALHGHYWEREVTAWLAQHRYSCHQLRADKADFLLLPLA